MTQINPKDISRCYDLLQHDPEQGLTQLLARDSEQIIGLGLFDNEDDFVMECERYNGLGDLFVGVNPRSNRLLDCYGGLKNRMRSVFVDVSDPTLIDYVTGIVIPGGLALSAEGEQYKREVSLLHDRERFFALGSPIPVGLADDLVNWIVEPDGIWSYRPDQYVQVPGTALMDGSLFTRRATFRRYRPYRLDGLSTAILEAGETN